MTPETALIDAKNQAFDVYAAYWRANNLLRMFGHAFLPPALRFLYESWVGVGVGLKKVADRQWSDQFELTLYLAAPPPLENARFREALHVLLPPPLSSMEFAIEVTGRYKPLVGPVTNQSIGVEGEAEPGTLGALVSKAGKQFILSNNHILYLNGSVFRHGDPRRIFCPAPTFASTGTEAAVGSVHSPVTREFKLVHGRKNSGDYAIAEVTNPAALPPRTAAGMPRLVSEKPVAANDVIGRKVKKFGYATQVTTGTITSVNSDLFLMYDSMNATFSFEDQIAIVSDTPGKPFAASGDSGSLVVTEDGHGVGLVFAGANGATLASPLTALFEKAELSFVLE